jgi:hypothetical protein
MGRHSRFSLKGVPILFGNSFPKSGTHLLTQVLRGLTRIGPAVDSGLPVIYTFHGTTGKLRDTERILHDLRRLRPGDVAYGHLHAVPELVAFLCQDGVAPYFIMRDPRDVVVSHVYYVTEMAPDHVHHTYYRELGSFDERLRVSILGRPDFEVPFPNIRQRFEPYLGWLDRLEMLVLRFEEMVVDREKSIGRMVDHAVNRGFPLAIDRDRAIEVLISSIQPERSPTFRRGKIGGWQDHFTSQHKQLFKDVAGDLLIRLGYEQNNDW